MSDARDLYKLFRELENQHQVNDTVGLHDSFDLELNEHFVIESGVVGLAEDGVIIQLDEAALEFLDFNGMLTESEEIEEMMVMGADSDASAAGSKTLGEGSREGVAWAIRQRILYSHKDVVAKYGPVRIMAAIKDRADSLDDLEEIGTSDTSIWTREVIDDLERGYYDDMDFVPVKRDVGESAEDPDIFAKIAKSDDPFQIVYDGLSGHFGEKDRMKLQDIYDAVASENRYHPDDDFEEIIDIVIDHIVADDAFKNKDELSEIKKLAFGQDALEENPMLMALGRTAAFGAARELAGNVDEGLVKNLAGAGAVIGALAAIAGIDKMEADRLMKSEPQLVTLTQMRQEAEQEGDKRAVDALDHRIRVTLNSIRDTGRPVMGPDGDPVDPRKSLGEAEYQGRKVTLNKPMQGDVAKSKVYVKKPDGKVVKVNFGDKNMTIKKSNPARRKSFRARHNCENPGPKWKARYWSCRAW